MECTKGEWTITFPDEGPPYRIGAVVEKQGLVSDNHVAFVEDLADAQLIAATPKMYKVLKVIINSETISSEDNFNNALEALAKAEDK